MKGTFLDFDSLSAADLDLADFENSLASWTFYPHTPAEQRQTRIGANQVVVVNKTLLDRAVLEQCPALKLIQVAATGYNNIDVEAAQALGIAVANVRDYGPESVAQHAFALILGLANRLAANAEKVSQGAWSESQHFCLLNHSGFELAGKVFGVVGYGAIGRAAARIAEGFGMQVIVAESLAAHSATDSLPRLPLTEVLAQADILSLHCPLTATTERLINADTLALMKPSALLINTARGNLVDEAALAVALQTQGIAGAGLDVLSQEPPAADHPLLQLQLPNLLITPHCAWGSREARQRLVDEMALNIRAFAVGEQRCRIV